MKHIYLIRGLPGEGKSTLALELMDNDPFRVIENDQYWSFNGINYGFCDAMWDLSRNWTLSEAFRRLFLYDSVAVSNVFYCKSLVAPYLKWASKLNIEVEVIRPKTPWVDNVQLCFEKNIHNCPLERIQMFKDKWEEIDQPWIDEQLR